MYLGLSFELSEDCCASFEVAGFGLLSKSLALHVISPSTKVIARIATYVQTI